MFCKRFELPSQDSGPRTIGTVACEMEANMRVAAKDAMAATRRKGKRMERLQVRGTLLSCFRRKPRGESAGNQRLKGGGPKGQAPISEAISMKRRKAYQRARKSFKNLLAFYEAFCTARSRSSTLPVLN